MNEETVVAAASSSAQEAPAAPVVDLSQGPLVGMTTDQRAEFRKTGELPKTPKTEDAASSTEAKPKGAAETAGESETPESKQEQNKSGKAGKTAEERIAELEGTIAKIKKGAGLENKPEAESVPAKPEPKVEERKPAEQKPEPTAPQPTRPKPTPEDVDKDGKPVYATYDDFVEDLTDWKGEQREAKQQRAREERAQSEAFMAQVDKARERYPDFDEAKTRAVEAIVNDAAIPGLIKQMLNDSDVVADLIYTIGSKPEELAAFVKMAKENPRKAISYIVLTESLINEELSGQAAKPAGEEAPTPAKQRTQAPRPPSEAGGRAAAPPDALESAAKAGDFRAFKAEQLRRDLAKLKPS